MTPQKRGGDSTSKSPRVLQRKQYLFQPAPPQMTVWTSLCKLRAQCYTGLALGLGYTRWGGGPGEAMHGPWLGPHFWQRSREDIRPGRWRQILFWVKKNKLAPRPASLHPSIQVWVFPCFATVVRDSAGGLASSLGNERAASTGQGPESDQKQKGRGCPAEPCSHVHLFL